MSSYRGSSVARADAPIRAVSNPLVALVIGLVRTFLFDTDVSSLSIRKLRLHSCQLLELHPRDFFVQMLRQHVYTYRISTGSFASDGPLLDMCVYLIG